MPEVVKRNQIIGALVRLIGNVKQGLPIGTTEARYNNTVKLIVENLLPQVNLEQTESPCVMLYTDSETRFVAHNAPEGAYEATWPIAVGLALRDPDSATMKKSRVARLLQSLFQDVDFAIHSEGLSLGLSPDVQISLDGYIQDIHSDPQLGFASIGYSIRYLHRSYRP